MAGKAAVSCYEVRDAGRKGVGLFATRHISAGTLILHEMPIIVFRKSEEAVTPNDLAEAVAGLSGHAKKRWARLRTVADVPNHANSQCLREFDISHPLVQNTFKLNMNVFGNERQCGVYNLGCTVNFSHKPNTRILGTSDIGMKVWAITAG
ncbi:hypothetical protein LTS10_009480 [Elasticomyces elasticus]|nr:hypothetical protein LTS10_009480 [Elasticomyces elasticus]